jgi:hypothetical protein
MKRPAAVAMLLVSLALPVCAQHGSAHGGGSGHSAPAFHGGGFSAPAARRSPGVTGYTSSRPFNNSRRSLGPAVGAYRGRNPYNGSWRYRRPYVSPYAVGFAYGAPGYIGPGYSGYSDDSGYDDSAAPQSPAPEGYDQQSDDPGPPPWPYGGAPQSAPAQQHPAASQASEDAVTLIFKDGRPPQQIHNYILTRDTLYIGDHHPDIPVDQIDLAATVKANRDAGVDFHLPGS